MRCDAACESQRGLKQEKKINQAHYKISVPHRIQRFARNGRLLRRLVVKAHLSRRKISRRGTRTRRSTSTNASANSVFLSITGKLRASLTLIFKTQGIVELFSTSFVFAP